MTILLYTGRPGAGKSYSSVSNVIIPAIKAGRTVVTNVVLKKSEIYSKFPDANIMSLDDSLSFDDADRVFNQSNFPAGSVFVIDECSEFFPSGQKQSNLKDTVLQFFTKHRHSVGINGKTSEIVLMTQASSQLSAWIRALIDTQYNHVKLDKHGFSNMFRVDVYDGCHTGENIPEKHLVKSMTGKYKGSMFKYYKSHTQNDTVFESGLEEKADKRGNHFHVYRNAILGILAMPFLLWFSYSTLVSAFGQDDIEPPASVIVGDENGGGSQNDGVEVKSSKSVIKSESDNKETFLGPKTRSEVLMEKEIKKALPYYMDDIFLKLPESEKYKLVGTIRSSSYYHALIRSESTTHEIDLKKQCTYRQVIREWVCVINGELVASYTGPIFGDEGVLDDQGSLFALE